MEDRSPATVTSRSALSWAALAFAIASLGFFAWYVPVDRRAYWELYLDFKVKFPETTRFVFDIPDVAFAAAAAGFTVAMIAVQWHPRFARSATAFHLLVALLCWIAFAAYRESLIGPFVTLMHALSGRPTGR
jgi:hypothetical protein